MSTERAADPAGVVRLATPEQQVPVELCRRDGQSVFTPHDAVRFTATRTLQLEHRILEAATAGTTATRAVADEDAVAGALRAHRPSRDQCTAVEALATSGAAVQCLVGPAGAGKSRTMATAATAWRTSGIPVQGVAVSAVAARVLREEAGIPAETIAKLLASQPSNSLPWGCVLVVDEAGMASTRDLAALLELTEHAHGKLVLVGDSNQLGPIEAGGLFTLLCEDHAVELDTLHRFTKNWEADASLRLRNHDPAVLDIYERHDRITEADEQGAVEHAAHVWFTTRTAGRSSVITATDHETVTAICEHIRQRRVERGDVEPDGVNCGGQIVGVGDEIVTLRNDRTLRTNQHEWVHNGDRWHVDARHPDGALTVSSLDGRGNLTLPPSYTAEHLNLAYAVTVHKAQGVTVDHAITIVDSGTSREHLYVGITRGRDSNDALVITEPADLDHHQPALTARDVLVAAMGRSGADQAATVHLRGTLARSESLAQLVPKLVAVEAEIKRAEPRAATSELQQLENRRRLVEQQRRPGWLTQAGRAAARELRDIDRQLATVRNTIAERDQWLADYQPLFDYRDHLQAAIDNRRHELGLAAAQTQPGYLIDRLGPVPDNDRERDIWISRASQIESYLDRHQLEATQLDIPPSDRQQHTDWRLDVELPIRAHDRDLTYEDIAERLATRELDLRQGIALEL